MLQGAPHGLRRVCFSLELHSGNKHSLPGADLTEQPKAFPTFQAGNIELLTIADHHGLFELKKTARTWRGCEQLRPKFTPT